MADNKNITEAEKKADLAADLIRLADEKIADEQKIDDKTDVFEAFIKKDN